MLTRTKTAAAAVALVAPLALVVSAGAAEAAPRVTFSSCDQLHQVFPYGVAKSPAAARAAVADGYSRPATSARAKKVYRANYKNLDRDRDGTACES